MAVDGIDGPGRLGRLSQTFKKESQGSDKEKDSGQQFYQKKGRHLTKFDFTKEEFEAVLKEFETLPFFKDRKFSLLLENEFPDTIIKICDESGSVIKRMTMPQFIEAVKHEKDKQLNGDPKTGHLLSKKA